MVFAATVICPSTVPVCEHSAASTTCPTNTSLRVRGMLHHIVAPPLDRAQLLHRTLVPQAAEHSPPRRRMRPQPRRDLRRGH